MSDSDKEAITLQKSRRFLPVRLTHDELKARVGQFTQTMKLKQEMEDRHATVKKDIKAEVDRMDGRVSRESEIIASEHEDRDVEVNLILYPNPARVDLVRMDTMAVLESRAAKLEELQSSLPLAHHDVPDPFAEGADAALAGHSDTSNPYEDGTDAQLSWNDGYNSVGEEVGDGDAE